MKYSLANLILFTALCAALVAWWVEKRKANAAIEHAGGWEAEVHFERVNPERMQTSLKKIGDDNIAQWKKLSDANGKYLALHKKLINDNRAAKAREAHLKKRIEEVEAAQAKPKVEE